MKKITKSSRVKLMAAIGLCALAIMCIPGYNDLDIMVNKTAGVPIVVIDPGHGGIDGGAVSRDGTNEKNINLSISLELKKQLEEEGMKVMLTRDEDVGLYDDSGEATIRSLKTQDVTARKNYIEKVRPDLAVSIHLNSFTQDENVKGAQVFYPADGDKGAVGSSERAAGFIQAGLNKNLNERSRSELSKGDVFLLKDVKVPTVIVECGFLSNPDDADSLRKRSHQKTICQIVKNGICKYMD
ncbi:MAG: hypothetical protein GX663_08195 [Clostridiales bacterium]|nr:hypothetical protein [Clostridiales bacterium]